MKKSILILSVLLPTSCSKKQLDKFDPHKLTIEVTYNNGDKDTVTTVTTVAEGVSLSEGDFKAYDGFKYEFIASGVRRYKIIKQETAYDVNGEKIDIK